MEKPVNNSGWSNVEGFTLVEVIAVLLLVAVLSAIALSRAAPTTAFSLKSQTEVIKDHLRYAQTRAMNSDVIWGINFSGNSYWLFTNGDVNIRVTLPGADADVVDLPPAMTVPGAIAAFDGWGRPLTGPVSEALQAGDRDIAVSLGVETEAITITQNTGFIR